MKTGDLIRIKWEQSNSGAVLFYAADTSGNYGIWCIHLASCHYDSDKNTTYQMYKDWGDIRISQYNEDWIKDNVISDMKLRKTILKEFWKSKAPGVVIMKLFGETRNPRG